MNLNEIRRERMSTTRAVRSRKSAVSHFGTRVFLLLVLAFLPIHHSLAQLQCQSVFGAVVLNQTPVQREYEQSYQKEFSVNSQKEWASSFTRETEYMLRDQSQGREKLEMLRALNIKNENGVFTAPNHLEFTKRYLEILKLKRISLEKAILPAVVLVKGKEFLLVTPGVDPWPTEPGFKILKSDELFNIPFRATLDGLRRGRFPLMEASHDVYHFVSFLMNPKFAEGLVATLSKVSAEKYPKTFSRRMFYILEWLTLGNPAKRAEMQKFFLFPGIRKGEPHHDFKGYMEFYETLPASQMVDHAQTMIKSYEGMMVDYGGASVRSFEKSTVAGSPFDKTSLSNRVSGEVLVSMVAPGVPPFLDSLNRDRVGGLHILKLQTLLEIRELSPEAMYELVHKNGFTSDFFADGFKKPLLPDYRERLDYLIRLQLARMEFFAWETANTATVDMWIQHGLGLKAPSPTPLTPMLRDTFGGESLLYRIFLN